MNINLNQNRQNVKKKLGIVQKIGSSFFFLIFGLFGLGFTIFMLSHFYQAYSVNSWKKTPCNITYSKLIDKSNGYKVDIKYSYQHNGKIFEGDKLKLNKSVISDYSEADGYIKKFHKGDNSCFVNPAAPEEAVLVAKVPWVMLPFLLIPAIFMLIGFGGIYAIWKKKSPAEEDARDIDFTPSSKEDIKKKQQKVMLFLPLFFLLFLVIGLAVGYFMFIKPVMLIKESENWKKINCKILHSKVKSHSGDKSTTYSVDILYSYRVKDKGYKSDRYDFFGGSSSGYQGKKEIVNRYPKGKKAKCYIDPGNPEEAVLSREYRTEMMLFAIIPFVFFLVGLIGVIGSTVSLLKKKRKAKELNNDDYSKSLNHNKISYEKSKSEKPSLKAQSSPLASIAGVAIFAIFWNGIISIFLYQVYKGFEKGKPEWFLTLFMIPFVLVGIGTILALIYTILKATNPKISIEVTPSQLYPGSDGEIKWTIKGKTSKISSFAIYLEGRERAEYRRGTNTATATNIFERIHIFSSEDNFTREYGNAKFTIQSDTMHSFKSAHNSIDWYITVHGEIKKWPDMLQKFPVTIHPNIVVTINEDEL